MSMEKTEVMWVRQQRKKMNIRIEERRLDREIGLSIWQEQ